jgi:hypothetical protein
MIDNSKFFSIYANLPDKVRDQIVVVIDDKPMTWNAAYIEIRGNTELGQKILEKLIRMEIIDE